MPHAAKMAAFGFIFAFVFSLVTEAQEPPPTPPKSPESLPVPVPLPDKPLNPGPPSPVPASFDGFDNSDTFGGGGGGRGGGFGGMGAFGGVGPNGPAMIALSDHTSWMPNERVSGQGTNFGFVKESIGLSVPFYRDTSNTFAFTTGVGSTIYTGTALLPVTDQPFPTTIWNIHFGVNYSHQFDNGWQGNFGVSIGSASDKPFEDWNQVYLGFHAMLRVPVGERNAWLFSLAYSPLGQLGFPVPGVAFQWVPNDWLRMNIGLPFQVIVTPDANWEFTASYMLLTTVHTQLAYRVAPKVKVYVGYDWGNDGFRLAEQEDQRQRFLYYEMKLNTGVKWTWGQFRFDVSGGYAFDRYFAQGNNVFDTFNRFSIGNGPFLGLSASYRW